MKNDQSGLMAVLFLLFFLKLTNGIFLHHSFKPYVAFLMIEVT